MRRGTRLGQVEQVLQGVGQAQVDAVGDACRGVGGGAQPGMRPPLHIPSHHPGKLAGRHVWPSHGHVRPPPHKDAPRPRGTLWTTSTACRKADDCHKGNTCNNVEEIESDKTGKRLSGKKKSSEREISVVMWGTPSANRKALERCDTDPDSPQCGRNENVDWPREARNVLRA